MDLSYEQILEIVAKATDKNWYDYTFLFSNFILSIGLIYVSIHIFIKTPKQNKLIKIQEKEIELLYKAFDHFFVFSDAVSLFISNKERKFQKQHNNENIEESFLQKEIQSSEKVYATFNDMNMASQILRSIGDKTTEQKVNIFETKAVDLRTKIYAFEKRDYSLSEIDNFLIELRKGRSELDKLKDGCFDSIANYKESLKL